MASIQSFALFYPDIKSLLKARKYEELKLILKEIPSIDIAQGWNNFTPKEKNIIFHLLDKHRGVELFEDLSFQEQNELINMLESTELSEILNEMSPDERADLFQDLSSTMMRKLFNLMKKEEVEDVQELMRYKENTAGGIMDTEFVELKKNMSAKQAILKLQESCKSHQVKKIYDLYITDDEHHLLGGISLQRLISMPSDMLLRDVMAPVQMIKINVDEDQEKVAQLFSKYDLLSAPVVDSQNCLRGIISIDDIVDVIQQENTEDIYGLGKISSVEKAVEINYSKASVLTLFRERIVWLFVLLLFGTFISSELLKGYRRILQSAVALAYFIPMLMDSGGNAGSQSLTMVVRALALGQISVTEARKIFLKEIFTGFISGVAMGLIAFFAVLVIQAFNYKLAVTVSVALTAVITLATLSGALLPLLFKKIGVDPAVSASPFITTVVDATCIIVYFEIASKLFL